MSSELQLFRVTVTKEWSAEGEALVWAPDQATAEKWAERQVNLAMDCADDCWTSAHGRPEPIDDGVLNRMADKDLWLVAPAPSKPRGCDRVRVEQFQALLSPKRLEAARLAKIEADNGQLPLLEVA
ncbi:MAG: hypothetical protein RLZZ468_1689 [Cyanobacteriota bacterium]|jgi:hypothetical protein